MSIMGGGSGGSKDKPVRPKPGMMEDPRRIYHGNPQNMDTGAFRTVGQPTMMVPKPLGWAAGAVKDKKNSLISGRMK